MYKLNRFNNYRNLENSSYKMEEIRRIYFNPDVRNRYHVLDTDHTFSKGLTRNIYFLMVFEHNVYPAGNSGSRMVLEVQWLMITSLVA